METSYDAKSWAKRTTLGRQVFNYNYGMLGSERPGWQLIKTVVMNQAKTEKTYLWQNTRAPDREMVRVRVVEESSWQQAQKSLVELLDRCMRPQIPPGPGGLMALGDVSFVARDPRSDVSAAIQFTRGNIVVSVNSAAGQQGQANVDVSEFAFLVDRALSEAPDKIAFLRRMAKSRTTTVVSVKAKQRYLLFENLERKVPHNEWLKIIAPGGELQRKRNTLTYLSSEPGRKRIAIYHIRRPSSP